jgi:hypothetical protein
VGQYSKPIDSFVGGNAFEAIPGGADAYVLSNFLVIWGDDQAMTPLRNCRRAIGENGKVLLVEWVMPAGSESKDGVAFWDATTADLMILGIYGNGAGRVRTISGFQELLAAAGFALTAVIPTRGSVSVIEAVPV